MKSRYAEIISHHEVYLGLDDTCHCFTSVDGDVTCMTVPALQSFHEEADTRMIFHLDFVAHVQEATNITIRSNDTDVLVILLYYMSQADTQIRVWLDAGLASNNTRRFISINDLVDKIGNDVLVALPGLHAFTGCNYTSSFLNKGKVKPMDIMMKSEEFLDALAKLGNGPLSDATFQTCEKFVCHLYGRTKLASVNLARHVIFQQTYAPKNMDDPLHSIKGVNPSSMPPCAKVLRKKLDRANYVSRMWKRAASQKPCDNHPDGHGWVFDSGTYKIQWYDGGQMPSDIYRVLDQNTQTPIVDEIEDEEVTYGEDLYGADEMNDDDDYI